MKKNLFSRYRAVAFKISDINCNQITKKKKKTNKKRELKDKEM